MSAIFGEILRFGQPGGPDIKLVVTGDEFHARHETLDGFTVVFDSDRRQFCYAMLVRGALLSSGVPVSDPPPAGLRRHLRESTTVANQRFMGRHRRLRQSARSTVAREAELTFGPSQGLLEGRRLSLGSVRGLTILVEFQDVRTPITKADVEELLNGQNYTRNGNFCSAREYFRTMSSGKLDYTNEVVGPFRLSQNRDYYITHLLVKEALDLAVAAGVDLKRYDSRGEGILDALNILYAGQTQYTGEIWPHNSFIDLRYGAVATNLYLLTSMGNSSGEMSIGTFCHENGHLLCRFPDMYDYGDLNRDGDGVKSAGIGSYCLMGSGNHLNSGRTPSPICSYLRDLAGWCDNQIALTAPGVLDAPHGEYRTVLKYPSSRPNEYFIVENRSKLGLDQFLPSSGLAIYHCDTLGSNEFQEGSTQRHYQCALLQADGHRDLELNSNQGDGGDLFSAVSGVALSSMTSPAARWWDGSDSGLVISDIEVPDAKIGFRLGAVPSVPGIRGENITSMMIPDASSVGILSRLQIAESATIKEAAINLDLTHTYIGDLIVELFGPLGQKAVLHNRTGASKDNLITRFDAITTPGMAVFVGADCRGEWLLSVKDMAGSDIGKLNRWSVEFVTDAVPKLARGEATPKLAIPDNNPTGISSSIEITQPGTVRQAKVSVDITHTYIGDLRLELVSPSGRSVSLHSQLGGGQDNLVNTYDSTVPLSPLAALAGQPMQGKWVLYVTDLAAADVGTLNKWSLELLPGN